MRRIVLSLAVLLAACNPNDFNTALDRAPVQFIARPDGFGSNGGRVLLPLPPPADQPKMAARLLFAGTESPSLGVADFDGDGKPHVQTIDENDLATMGLTNDGGGITSIALLGGPTPNSPGTLALGMAHHIDPAGPQVPGGLVAFANLVPGTNGKLSLQRVGAATNGSDRPGHFGLAVATGRVTQPATDEAIVVGDVSVHIMDPSAGPLAHTNCMTPSGLPPDFYRSLAVADFLSGGNHEIAIGLPVLGGTGLVFLLQYGPNPNNPMGPAELFCAGTPFGMPNASGEAAMAGFGTSLTPVPDLNGDGLAELVVGAPPDRAYLIYSPFDGSRPAKLFIKDDATSEFGQRVALVDIDADGVKELAITALQANVGNTPKAGQVFVYKIDGDGKTPVAVLYDSSPTAKTEFFGIGLADLEFNSARTCPKGRDAHVLLAGADAGIFTFFHFARSAPDPRCFAQK
jgi:hypothetical protein